jgi:hypothetical protein
VAIKEEKKRHKKITILINTTAPTDILVRDCIIKINGKRKAHKITF